MENSERLGGQARSGTEPGTSRLPLLSAEQLRHWWGTQTVPEYRNNNGFKIDLIKIQFIFISLKELFRISK